MRPPRWHVTGTGAFGVNDAGTVILSGLNNTYSGGTIISNGTLQFGDGLTGALPPPGNITVDGIDGNIACAFFFKKFIDR